ncbi:DUF4492 domain-containing protein [Dysgonomonas sp. 216]|uniref:DUF4492 domain-containing protein n=1 Tax=Dysgonomonas sp. 216 TaxID=2302934 RepID=UPI0013D6D186|nr:DUF4492 domain-containing protein [Dysgonomonas sp. 216]NDW17838.1 DUF4492 domain-containing protein [Dysgonomonas sp. 216]
MEGETQKFNFYSMFRDGFRNMTLGKTLWILVIIKLIIMFLILRPFFFPNFLGSKFDDSEDKADYVRQQLIERTESESEDKRN